MVCNFSKYPVLLNLRICKRWIDRDWAAVVCNEILENKYDSAAQIIVQTTHIIYLALYVKLFSIRFNYIFVKI